MEGRVEVRGVVGGREGGDDEAVPGAERGLGGPRVVVVGAEEGPQGEQHALLQVVDGAPQLWLVGTPPRQRVACQCHDVVVRCTTRVEV